MPFGEFVRASPEYHYAQQARHEGSPEDAAGEEFPRLLPRPAPALASKSHEKAEEESGKNDPQQSFDEVVDFFQENTSYSLLGKTVNSDHASDEIRSGKFLLGD